jgi:hypothetical protein
MKLDQATARKVHNAEGSSIALVDEDEYVLKLDKVTVAPKPDKNGNSYWLWYFSITSGQTTGDKFKGKTVRTNTGFGDDQLWYAKMMFEAFEVKPNVDTDTLLGKEIKGIVGQREIQSGSRKGQLANDLQTMLPLSAGADDDDWSADPPKDGKGAAADDEPDF